MERKTKPIRYPRRRFIRGALRAGIIAVLGTLAEIKIEGRENLPKEGPLVVIGNHFSFLDPVAMIHAIPYPMEFLGGLRTPNAPAWTEVFRVLWGVIRVRRGTSTREPLLAAQSLLKEHKGVLSIFPEGGNWATVLRPARPGAALLAARSGSLILPVGFDGLTEVFPKFGKGKRARVDIRIGKPFGPFQLVNDKRSHREQLDEFGHELMKSLAALIPPERRGHYSDDPAIRAAAQGTEIYPWANMIEE